MFTMIVMAVVLVVVTAAIAKLLRIGSNEFYREPSERAKLVGRSCCLSGLADFSEDLHKGRDAT